MPRQLEAFWMIDPASGGKVYKVMSSGKTILSGHDHATTHRILRDLGFDDFGLRRVKLLVEAEFIKWN